MANCSASGQRTPTKRATPDALRAQAFPSPDLPRLGHLGLCSVVPELLPAWEQMAAASGYPLTILTGQSTTPLRNAYLTPETLGADRLLAAVAAAARVGTPVIPLHAGTATVVDAVSPEGAYLGGMITPGHRQHRYSTHGCDQHPSAGSMA